MFSALHSRSYTPNLAGEDIISAVGAEVDRIETEIQAINPGIRYVDLETDRGQVGNPVQEARQERPNPDYSAAVDLPAQHLCA